MARRSIKEISMEKLEKAIEEAAFEFKVDYKPFERNLDYREYAEFGFIKGAKSDAAKNYHQKGMFSHEDMRQAFIGGINYGMDETNCTHPDFNNWFDDYKK